MTIVVGVSSLFDAFVVADCRLTYPASGRPVYRDVCQKLVIANAWSVVGFAGDLCMARSLLSGFVHRLRDTSHDDPAWLKDDAEVVRLASYIVSRHAELGANHARCQQAAAHLLVTWIDYDRPADDPRSSDMPVSQLLVLRSPQMDVRRTFRGVDCIGRKGRRVARALREEAFDMLSRFGRFAGDQEYVEAHRALIGTQVVRDLLADVGGDETVGGLFQVATISRRGVETVPYFYLADVEPGYRTYVAMRPMDGEYVQEHRPTGTSVHIASPFDIDPRSSGGQHRIFDPARMLTRSSPGVVPAKSQGVAFSIYDPSNVPAEVRETWGDEPLPPATWATPPPCADDE